MGAPLSPGASMAGMAVSMGTEADLVASGFVLLAGEDGSLGSAPFRRQQLMAALAEQQRAQQRVATLKAGVPQAHLLASLRTQSWRGSSRPYGRDPGQLAPILSESLQQVATSPQQEALSSQHELNSLCRHVGEGFGGKEGERPARRISQAQQRKPCMPSYR